MSADALQDVSVSTAVARGLDLYFCPHCGFKVATRVPRSDLIDYCWGPCLELYGEPIPITFVRGLGAGRPALGMPF